MSAGRKIAVSFIGALMVLGVVGVVSFFSVTELRDDSRWVEHTLRVISELRHLLALSNEVESKQRGFAITGEVSYLSAYQGARAGAAESLGSLRTLVADNSARLAEVAQLAERFERRWRRADEVIASGQSEGLEVARQGILTGVGRELQADARELLDAMIAGEEGLLVQRRQRADRRVMFTQLVIVFGSLLAFAVAGAAWWALRAANLDLESQVRDRTRQLADTNRELGELNADLEQRVQARTVQLEVANRELEAFTYSVSHDLRAPLRSLSGYSQALIEDYQAELPEDGQRFLRNIGASAKRMGVLIDDLLAFSRLNRQSLRKGRIDTRQMVEGVVAELAQDGDGRRPEVAIGELPASQGDLAMVKQVWVNLLSNAFKFTGKKQEPRVEVDSETSEGGVTVFRVRDNGSGFDMRYVGKLFGVFQRLHRADEFEGTGVGLAIVQRIVHRHGGKVWAEGAVDRGATFYFTLEGDSP